MKYKAWYEQGWKESMDLINNQLKVGFENDVFSKYFDKKYKSVVKELFEVMKDCVRDLESGYSIWVLAWDPTGKCQTNSGSDSDEEESMEIGCVSSTHHQIGKHQLEEGKSFVDFGMVEDYDPNEPYGYMDMVVHCCRPDDWVAPELSGIDHNKLQGMVSTKMRNLAEFLVHEYV